MPRVIAVARIPSVKRDAVHYHPLEGTTLRSLLRGGLDPETEARLKKLFTGFVIRLHALGIYFRSLHLGNVVCTPEGRLGLIDFSDLRIHPWALGRYLRARNMRRMMGMAEERDWVDSEAIGHGRPPTLRDA